MTMQNQKTIRDEIKLCGVGLHNGKKVNLLIKPKRKVKILELNFVELILRKKI